MNQNRFNQVMAALKADALKIVKQSAPVRTGNLQDSVRARDLPGGGFEIYIDTQQAYYAEYTIEPWIHDRWNGRENPNEGWTDEAMKHFIKRARIRLGGQITSKGKVK